MRQILMALWVPVRLLLSAVAACLYAIGWLMVFALFWWIMIPYYIIVWIVRGAVRAELRKVGQ